MATRALGTVALALGLAGCSGEETPPPAPQPEPVVEAKRDTGTPRPVESPEEKARREYFEKLAAGEPVPAPVPAPAPAPEPVPVAPAPAPAPVATAPKPKPVPVAPEPLPKPTTTQNGATPRPTPRPTVPAPVVVAPAAVAVVAVQPSPVPAPGAAPEPAAVVAPEPAAARPDPLERCGDPAGIEAMAARGALSNADLACLDEAFATAEATADRERISLVAITNAYAADDKRGQEDALHRHLTEVDGWNPELAWRYALVLYQKGGSPAEIVQWSDVALEHRTGWTHDVYDKRVYSAYKLRAAASQDLLERAEDQQEANPSDETDRALVAAREDTKRAAREWYGFALQTGQESQAALDLCLIASQSVAYCEGT